MKALISLSSVSISLSLRLVKVRYLHPEFLVLYMVAFLFISRFKLLRLFVC